MRIFLWTITMFMLGIANCTTQASSNETYIKADHKDLSDKEIKELYGPIIKCDPSLKEDELTKCVDKKYLSMKKSGKEKFIEETFLYLPKEKQDIPSEYKRIKNFKDIKTKDVYKNNAPYSTPISQYRMDTYDGMEFGVEQNPWYITFSLYKKDNPSESPWRLSSFGGVDKYVQNFNAVSKDILIIKDKGKSKIYTASYEIVPLKGGKAFYIIAIANFCQISSYTKIFESSLRVDDQDFPLKGCIELRGHGVICGNSKDDLTKLFDQCGTNYIYFVDDLDRNIEYTRGKDNPNFKYSYYVHFNDYPDKVIHLSADRRKDPSQLYIKLGNNIFSLTFSNNGGFNKE